MLVHAVALGCALLLTQTPGPEAPPPTAIEAAPAPPPEAVDDVPPRVEEPPPAAPVALPTPPSLAPSDKPLPMQRWERPTVCLRLAPTAEVPSGRWRAQCDDTHRRCLVAPARELDIDGIESDRPLERVAACMEEDMARVPPDELRTYEMQASIAEAPPGWYRDERGRVMQFNFDLNRRIWVGGAWSPLSPALVGEGRRDRVRLDFGIALDIDHKRALHRLRFLETELSLGEPSTDFTAVHYDLSVERQDPAFRITTFLGEPRRHDFFLNLGLWVDFLRVEDLKRGDVEGGFITWGAVHGTLDLWHSRDLVSFVRLRAGPAVERDYVNDTSALVPSAVLEGDLTLDRDGFHHLRFAAKAEKLLLARDVPGRDESPERLRLQAGYELILLAINDQPLSLVVDGRGTWRNDLPGLPDRWEWSASAGLRFSFWAPPRRAAPTAEHARD
ncbi:hypothetical protein LZ198_08730 [Myxococcus sp. K15C18031901]|uniref:hypothetical protein n=1 Tax=Myxococcus dinghuensis TaxID=2906761 RepID=UPI0020A78E68|nr:hypothetical protein [Myxococcus dinghuensis]MCP3098960.1 hypothetical protein [Myxococcus dinghuensis]